MKIAVPDIHTMEDAVKMAAEVERLEWNDWSQR